MKKYLCLITVALLIFSLCACDTTDALDQNNDDTTTSASADNNNVGNNNLSSEKAVSKDEDFVANDTDNGYYIIDYLGDAQIIKVPEVLNGKTVEGISYSAFYDVAIEEIYFPSTITEIEAHTFEQQKSMKKAVLNEGLKKIGDYAFVNCYELTEVNIPSTVEEIGRAAFCQCRSLSEITLPEGLTSIDSTAFGACAVTSITIPASLTVLNKQVFDNCKNLIDVYILNEQMEINYDPFSACPSVVLHGKSGSTTEAYATENDIPFVAE